MKNKMSKTNYYPEEFIYWKDKNTLVTAIRVYTLCRHTDIVLTLSELYNYWLAKYNK
jgi:hypothetical protein